MPHTLTTREAQEEKNSRWSWCSEYLNNRFQRAKRLAEGKAREHGTLGSVELWRHSSLEPMPTMGTGWHTYPGDDAHCETQHMEIASAHDAERFAETVKAVQAIADSYNEERGGLIEDLEEENRKTDGLVSDDADTHKEAIKRAKMKVAQAEKNLRDAKEWLMIIKQDAEKAGVEIKDEKE